MGALTETSASEWWTEQEEVTLQESEPVAVRFTCWTDLSGIVLLVFIRSEIRTGTDASLMNICEKQQCEESQVSVLVQLPGDTVQSLFGFRGQVAELHFKIWLWCSEIIPFQGLVPN